MVSGTLVGAQQGPLFTQQIGVCLMRSSLVSTEEISDNVGQGFLSQNVCTTVCVCMSIYVLGEGVHHFHHILKWLSEIYSFERLFAQHEPGLGLSAGGGSPHRVQMDSAWV